MVIRTAGDSNKIKRNILVHNTFSTIKTFFKELEPPELLTLGNRPHCPIVV